MSKTQLTESAAAKEVWVSIPGFEVMISLRNSGLSLPAIAKNLNVSLATINKWMHGRTQLAKQLWRGRK